jgi:hypothetical protein
MAKAEVDYSGVTWAEMGEYLHELEQVLPAGWSLTMRSTSLGRGRWGVEVRITVPLVGASKADNQQTRAFGFTMPSYTRRTLLDQLYDCVADTGIWCGVWDEAPRAR